MTLPPSPPSPPSGPPRGTYFSRRKLTHPSPPRPASSWISTRSTNIDTAGDFKARRDQGRTSRRERPLGMLQARPNRSSGAAGCSLAEGTLKTCPTLFVLSGFLSADFAELLAADDGLDRNGKAEVVRLQLAPHCIQQRAVGELYAATERVA